MDPFMEVFQELLRRGKPMGDALKEVYLLVRTPENQAMLSMLADSNVGRTLLLKWQQEWRQMGLSAPWVTPLTV